MLPSLVLQPFAENVIKHGFTFTTLNKKIRLNLLNDVDFLTIQIFDNGRGLKEDEFYITKEKSGLGITKKRLEFFAKKFDSKSSLTICNNNKEQEVKVEN